LRERILKPTNGDPGLEGLNKRIDTLTAEVVDTKGELRVHGDLLRAMQQTQQEMVKSIVNVNSSMTTLNQRVDRIELGQERLIQLVSRIVDRLTDFEVGATIELENVTFDEPSKKLSGTMKKITK
jgi:allophanate hydrolase subunit 1